MRSCPFQADYADNIWVPILVTTGANSTEARGTTLQTIAPGTAHTITQVAALSTPFMGGIGDMTGRYSAQPPALGTWQWVHDTHYPGAFVAADCAVLTPMFGLLPPFKWPSVHGLGVNPVCGQPHDVALSTCQAPCLPVVTQRCCISLIVFCTHALRRLQQVERRRGSLDRHQCDDNRRL